MNVRMKMKMIAFVCQIEVTDFVHDRMNPAKPQVTSHVMANNLFPFMLPTTRNSCVTEEIQATVEVYYREFVQSILSDCGKYSFFAIPIVKSEEEALKEVA